MQSILFSSGNSPFVRWHQSINDGPDLVQVSIPGLVEINRNERPIPGQRREQIRRNEARDSDIWWGEGRQLKSCKWLLLYINNFTIYMKMEQIFSNVFKMHYLLCPEHKLAYFFSFYE